MSRWARLVYSGLMVCAQPLLLRKLRRRAVAEPGYGQHVGERLGRYPRQMDSLMPHSSTHAHSPLVWIHAVSLGETRAAAILLGALRSEIPGMRLLLTHGTATGRAEGEKLLQPGDLQVWQPWDTPGAVARFLQRFRPSVGILMETEVWPNLIEGCRRRGIPLVLANARLNTESLRKALRLARLSKPAYAGLAAVWAQTAADAERLQTLGAPVRGVLGNLKFDLQPDPHLLAQGRAWRAGMGRPVVMLASSREDEEALWIDALRQKTAPTQTHQALKAIKSGAIDSNAAPAVQWLIVPRHPQRFAQVEQLLRDAGLRVSRRSAWAQGPQEADVWLGDTLGEMPLYYGMADVALMGGSFAPLGGQNLIEAAACGCPVVLGPHTFNFAQAAQQACEEGAAVRVQDMDEALTTASALVQDASHLEALRSASQVFAQAHRGAAQATARAVHAMLKDRALL